MQKKYVVRLSEEDRVTLKWLVNRFEFHHTPKHDSWINIAEIELSVLSRQCLAGCIPNKTILAFEVGTWEAE